jgi:hypothetical protein
MKEKETEIEKLQKSLKSEQDKMFPEIPKFKETPVEVQ